LDTGPNAWAHIVRATLISGVPADWLSQPSFDLWFSIISLILVASGTYVARKSVVPYWLAPIVIHVMASFAFHKNLLIPRYLFVYVPACCIAFGALCGALLTTRYRVGALALSAGYATFAMIGIANILFVPFYQFPDWYQVNEVVLANEQRNDLIVLDQGAEYWVVHDFSGFRNHQTDAPGIRSDVPRTIRWLEGYPKRRVWYIENQPGFTDPQQRVKASLDATRTLLRAWRQNRLYREDTVLILLYGTRESRSAEKKAVSTTSP
jgi:hypothetical protein